MGGGNRAAARTPHPRARSRRVGPRSRGCGRFPRRSRPSPAPPARFFSAPTRDRRGRKRTHRTRAFFPRVCAPFPRAGPARFPHLQPHFPVSLHVSAPRPYKSDPSPYILRPYKSDPSPYIPRPYTLPPISGRPPAPIRSPSPYTSPLPPYTPSLPTYFPSAPIYPLSPYTFPHPYTLPPSLYIPSAPIRPPRP